MSSLQLHQLLHVAVEPLLLLLLLLLILLLILLRIALLFDTGCATLITLRRVWNKQDIGESAGQNSQEF